MKDVVLLGATIENAKIKGLMAENDETQTDLAKVLNCSVTTVGSYLRGKTAMSLETITQIADHYKVEPLNLLKIVK